VKFQQFKIQNIVGSSDVKFAIDLDKVFEKHKEFCSYEAEVFPGK
jgi:transcription initiation factor TFIID TATA-box-binding protein